MLGWGKGQTTSWLHKPISLEFTCINKVSKWHGFSKHICYSDLVPRTITKSIRVILQSWNLVSMLYLTRPFLAYEPQGSCTNIKVTWVNVIWNKQSMLEWWHIWTKSKALIVHGSATQRSRKENNLYFLNSDLDLGARTIKLINNILRKIMMHSMLVKCIIIVVLIGIIAKILGSL